MDALESGDLLPLLERVQNDDTLSLEIRNGYVDIYYRGGRLLGLHAISAGRSSKLSCPRLSAALRRAAARLLVARGGAVTM